MEKKELKKPPLWIYLHLQIKQKDKLLINWLKKNVQGKIEDIVISYWNESAENRSNPHRYEISIFLKSPLRINKLRNTLFLDIIYKDEGKRRMPLEWQVGVRHDMSKQGSLQLSIASPIDSISFVDGENISPQIQL